MKFKIVLLFLITNISFAQIKGVVKDSITGKPIPYVSVWVQNENIGTTSEENGEFKINSSEKSKKLIFSSLGFEKKIVKASECEFVRLKPSSFQLDEVDVTKHFESKIIEIGKTKNETYQAFDNGPKIDTKFFPYKASYKKTRFIKKVSLFADNTIENASIKLHFYNVDENGFPGDEILKKDFIVTLKKGVLKTTFDLSEFNLRMPKRGIFVGFEKLIIEKNKIEKTTTNFNNNTTRVQISYAPSVLYNFVEREILYNFSGGKWNKQTKLDTKGLPVKTTVFEPAINLILTN